jgi:FAD/FMN-containing dehydrogenase
MRPDRDGIPPADVIAAPSTPEEMAELLARATEARAKVLVWGGGTHQGYGHRIEPDLLISTSRLNRIIDWQPDDLTVVAEAGLGVAALEDQISTRGQTAALPETRDGSTLGGVLAAGVSGYRRARYGPSRDRMLEVTVVTGDGRLVRAGARVVKNVTGYDLPRLVVGSFGALGVIVSVCLKLWPNPGATATVTLDDPERAVLVYRPMAVLRDPLTTRIYLGGTPEEVDSQLKRLGGTVADQLLWPPPTSAKCQWSLRVTPSLVSEALRRLPAESSFVAQMLVGEIAVGTASPEGMNDLRGWAESVGGCLVLVAAPAELYEVFDPWGSPPSTVELQRRLIASFDPGRVINPGRLPGGI